MSSNTNNENTKMLLEEASNSIRNNVAAVATIFSKIKWKNVSFIIPTIPKPAQRPRLCGHRVYVPNAAKNGSFFQRKVLPTLKDLFITTPCKIHLEIYIETPKSFTKTQKILAEMRILRPWTVGDNDNFEKAVWDMIQPNKKRGHIGILENDGLVIDNDAHKYYSMSPRYELSISFMKDIPDELKTVLRLIK